MHAADELRGPLEFAEHLIAPEHALQVPEGVDETAGVGHGLVHLGPQVAELACHEVGPAREFVEITGTVGDLLGALVQLAADLDPPATRALACSSDCPSGRVMPLTVATPFTWLTPLCHLLQVGKGLRRAQVVR